MGGWGVCDKNIPLNIGMHVPKRKSTTIYDLHFENLEFDLLNFNNSKLNPKSRQAYPKSQTLARDDNLQGTL